jgi:FkbM family methyltransferase
MPILQGEQVDSLNNRKATPRERLAEIVDGYLPDLASREAAIFDELVAPVNGELVIFGAGGLGKKLVLGLARLGIRPLAITDNNQALWGSTIDRIAVIDPRDAATRFGERAAFVIAIWRVGMADGMADSYAQMTSLGCVVVTSFAPLFWRNPEIFLPHFRFALPSQIIKHRESILAAFSLWEDDISRGIYLTHLEWLLGMPTVLNGGSSCETYFDPSALALSKNEVFVDCGAYDGDTLSGFLRSTSSQFCRILAFEPDCENLEKLMAMVESLPADVRRRIDVHGYAIGSETSTGYFECGGVGSKLSPGGSQQVEIRPLDELLFGIPATYIKMDIEGDEPHALAGAAKTILEQSPKLAICVYHEPEHLWQLPLLIKSLNPGYTLKLRHYAKTLDLVCHAQPGEANEIHS